MDIREAFNSVMSLILEHDRHFDHKYLVIERRNLQRYWWRAFETAADIEADYLDELHDVILNVTHRDDGGYIVHYRPFTWEPHNQYDFSCKMFRHIFHKYDPQLVEACIKLAQEDDGMLYSEIRDATNDIRRCHYGVKVYNKDTGEWEKVYEGTFKL